MSRHSFTSFAEVLFCFVTPQRRFHGFAGKSKGDEETIHGCFDVKKSLIAVAHGDVDIRTIITRLMGNDLHLRTSKSPEGQTGFRSRIFVEDESNPRTSIPVAIISAYTLLVRLTKEYTSAKQKPQYLEYGRIKIRIVYASENNIEESNEGLMRELRKSNYLL